MATAIFPERLAPPATQATDQLSGRAVFDGSTCQIGEDIKSGDLVAANFDIKEVHSGGGLYLVEERLDGRVVWRGCRRMTSVPEGVSIDINGCGNWKTYQSLEAIHWHVVGVVETVYKPTHYQEPIHQFRQL